MFDLKMERCVMMGHGCTSSTEKIEIRQSRIQGILSYAGDTCHSILHEILSLNS